MIKTPLSLRWKRAQAIVRNNVPLGYTVSVRIDERDLLTGCGCSCPDFNKKMSGMGIPVLRGIRVCKHALALALRVLSTIEENAYV